MSTTRRRVLRPVRDLGLTAVEARRIERRITRLKARKSALDRWTSKLKRAFNAVQRL